METLQALLEQEQNKAKSFKLFSTFSLTEEQTNLIDSFQSKIKSLSGTLSAIENHSFSDSDMVDLLQKFPATPYPLPLCKASSTSTLCWRMP